MMYQFNSFYCYLKLPKQDSLFHTCWKNTFYDKHLKDNIYTFSNGFSGNSFFRQSLLVPSTLTYTFPTVLHYSTFLTKERVVRASYKQIHDTIIKDLTKSSHFDLLYNSRKQLFMFQNKEAGVSIGWPENWNLKLIPSMSSRALYDGWEEGLKLKFKIQRINKSFIYPMWAERPTHSILFNKYFFSTSGKYGYVMNPYGVWFRRGQNIFMNHETRSHSIFEMFRGHWFLRISNIMDYVKTVLNYLYFGVFTSFHSHKWYARKKYLVFIWLRKRWWESVFIKMDRFQYISKKSLFGRYWPRCFELVNNIVHYCRHYSRYPYFYFPSTNLNEFQHRPLLGYYYLYWLMEELRSFTILNLPKQAIAEEVMSQGYCYTKNQLYFQVLKGYTIKPSETRQKRDLCLDHHQLFDYISFNEYYLRKSNMSTTK